ncbi:MAG: hypothetical protein KAJ93_02430 [Methanosarcinales archaeon]|nr:hypothetical protein [Methanosarcinales archaeon]
MREQRSADLYSVGLCAGTCHCGTPRANIGAQSVMRSLNTQALCGRVLHVSITNLSHVLKRLTVSLKSANAAILQLNVTRRAYEYT